MAKFPTLRVKYSRRMQMAIQEEMRRTGRDWVTVGAWFLVDVEDEGTIHAAGHSRKDMEMALQMYNNGLRKLRDE